MMWQELGYDEPSCEDLLMELRAYRRKEKPYTQKFNKEKESALKWWLSIDAQKDSLVELAIKIFSIPPSQAVCERNFSTLKWIFGDRRTRLNIFRLEAIAKIRAFCYTNIKNELSFYGKELLECDLRDSVNGSTVNASQMEFVEQSEKSSDSFEPISGSCDVQLDEVNDTNLLIDEIIDLSNPAFIGNNNYTR